MIACGTADQHALPHTRSVDPAICLQHLLLTADFPVDPPIFGSRAASKPMAGSPEQIR
jgi:hypothetical protein